LRDAIPPLKSPAPQAAALPMPQATASVSVLIIDPLKKNQVLDYGFPSCPQLLISKQSYIHCRRGHFNPAHKRVPDLFCDFSWQCPGLERIQRQHEKKIGPPPNFSAIIPFLKFIGIRSGFNDFQSHLPFKER
jgi:hypothetical protein